ncbi:MAG: T9SS type A sorting domain-containing protein [Bacteroidetes bacterium]|nr:T9SS type A sorting domain-containing protein [Bacteroidota bacterium]
MKYYVKIALAILFSHQVCTAQVAADKAIIVTTAVQANPPQVSFTWSSAPSTLMFQILRKTKDTLHWTYLASPATNATSYTDTTILPGIGYEYKFYRNVNYVIAETYVYTGVLLPEQEYRGKLLLLIDSTFKNSLAADIKILISDLVGDGWQVVPKYVSRTDNPKTIKRLIRTEYQKDTANVKAIYLFGHVPVPYSGNYKPDEHPDHQGAWPADMYYSDLDTTFWTDANVNITTATRPENDNIPGDGKFDVSYINYLSVPTKFMVGRVDLSNMPAFSSTETQLLKQYITKSHSYKHKLINPQRKALIDDNFGYFYEEAFAANGWRNFSALFGPSNIVTTDYFTTMASQSYLFSYGCGGGSYTSCGGVGNTSNFASTPLNNVFTMLFGSYFGDWDSQNNFLRAPLASSGWCLANIWAGRPNAFFHHMGMGEPIGHGALISQNNTYTYLSYYNYYSLGAHFNLMGDPTLRLHTVAPISSLKTVFNCPNVELNWNASADAVLGYNVYRLDTISERYIKLNTTLITGLSFTDSLPYQGSNNYMVRAMLLENGSGTYYNLSQGIFDTLQVDLTTPTASVTANSPKAFCQGGSVTLSSTANTSYAWSNGATTQAITITTNGIYNVTVTGSNGCKAASGNDTTIVYSLPIVNLGNDTLIYFGDSLMLNAGNTSATYTWSNGDTTQTTIIKSSGTYWVNVSDSNGCETTDSVQVTVSFANSIANAYSTNENYLSIYPNPASTILNIQVKCRVNAETKLVMYNCLGQKEFEGTGSNNYKLDISTKPSGVYFMQLLDDGKIKAQQKIIVE